MAFVTDMEPIHPILNDPIRILLLYAWGNGNAGDKALALGTVESLRCCFPSATIHVASIYPEESDDFDVSRRYLTARHPDVHVIPADFMPRRGWSNVRIIRLLDKALISFSFLCPPILRFLCRKSIVFRALDEADVVILNGGHLLFWSDRMGQKQRMMAKYVFPLMVARRLGKCYGLHAQSYGPFEFSKRDWLFRRAFRYVFTGASYLSVRESASLSHLKTCIGDTDRVKRVLDSAFFLTERDEKGAAEILKRYGLISKQFLAVALRLSKRGSQKDLPSEEHESYARKIAEFVSLWTSRELLPVLFVSQVPKDVEDTRFILSKLPDAQRDKCVVLEHIASPELLTALYANAAAVIGMRFHSLIFSLLANAPIMGVYYYDIGPKIKGIMDDLGYPEYALSLNETSGSALYQSASRLLADAAVVSKALARRVSSLKRASLNAITDQITPGKELRSRKH
jgi:colanic acid/amylovoran biosynthesis protein